MYKLNRKMYIVLYCPVKYKHDGLKIEYILQFYLDLNNFRVNSLHIGCTNFYFYKYQLRLMTFDG